MLEDDFFTDEGIKDYQEFVKDKIKSSFFHNEKEDLHKGLKILGLSLNSYLKKLLEPLKGEKFQENQLDLDMTRLPQWPLSKIIYKKTKNISSTEEKIMDNFTIVQLKLSIILINYFKKFDKISALDYCTYLIRNIDNIKKRYFDEEMPDYIQKYRNTLLTEKADLEADLNIPLIAKTNLVDSVNNILIPEAFSVKDFFLLLEKRLRKLADILPLPGDTGARFGNGRRAIAISNTIQKTILEHNLIGNGFWGYGINKIYDSQKLYSNKDLTEIEKTDPNNRHIQNSLFHLILFTVKNDYLYLNTFTSSFYDGTVSSQSNELSLRLYKTANIQTHNSKVFIKLNFDESPYPVYFQIDSYLSSPSSFANYYIKSIELLKKSPHEQGIFQAGETFDALMKISDIIQKAQNEIVIIDPYINEQLIQFIKDRNKNAFLKLITFTKSNTPSLQLFVTKAKTQFGKIDIMEDNTNHDRFIIIDKTRFYHFGASLKDAGNKTFMYSEIIDLKIQNTLLSRIT